jgi:hypothetical protein
MSLLDPKWKYTHSTATDIRKTFAKARKALAKKKDSDARMPKLQLMCAPSDSAGTSGLGSRPKTSLFGTRSLAGEGGMDHSHEDRRPSQSDRRIA